MILKQFKKQNMMKIHVFQHKKPSHLLLTLSLLLVCFAQLFTRTRAISCPNGTDSVAIQLGWVFQAQYAGFIAAKEMGYFENECLNVVIKQGLLLISIF